MLDVRSLLGMPAQIPARLYVFVREHGIHTGFGSGRIENELRLSVLLQHGVVAAHRHRSVWVAVRGYTYPKNTKVHPEAKNSEPQYAKQDGQEDAPQPIP